MRRPDTGRLVMVPVAAAVLGCDLITLGHGTTAPLAWPGTILTGAFYVLIIWCYLRRRPAVAGSRSVTAHAAAIIATATPFAIPLLRAGRPGAGAQLAAGILLTAGTGWAVWSLRSLGASLSVLAQARQLAERGPYRWVRHPLYLGEVVAALGLALIAHSAAAAAVWLALCALQGYRARTEERVLAAALPEYADYRRRTAALIPGLRSDTGLGGEPPRLIRP